MFAVHRARKKGKKKMIKRLAQFNLLRFQPLPDHCFHLKYIVTRKRHQTTLILLYWSSKDRYYSRIIQFPKLCACSTLYLEGDLIFFLPVTFLPDSLLPSAQLHPLTLKNIVSLFTIPIFHRFYYCFFFRKEFHVSNSNAPFHEMSTTFSKWRHDHEKVYP